jgi:GT2 family glycosyltransferase
VELLDSIMNIQQDKYIEKIKYAATANLFTRKDVFERVGLFNSEVKSGGDRDWGQRVAASGYKLVYADNARVLHPARSSMSQLKKKVVRVIGGHHQLENRSAYPLLSLDFYKTLGRDLVPPVKFTIRLSRDARVKGVGNKLKVLYVFILIRLIRAWARIRLQFGSAPARE